jgi:hypothetical protein
MKNSEFIRANEEPLGACDQATDLRDRRQNSNAKTPIFTGMLPLIRNAILRRHLFFIGGALVFRMVFLTAVAQPDTAGYCFFAGGHWYGAHENYRSIYPASSLLQAIPRINAANPAMVFALGDVVRDAHDSHQWAAFDSLTAHIHSETIHLKGNHDQRPVDFILKEGKGVFRIYNDIFLMLETETLIHGGGNKMLRRIRDARFTSMYDDRHNLFVFSHRLLWALTEPGFREMDDFANEPFTGVSQDTLQMVYDAVVELAGDRPMYWFSGDIGASWSYTVFEGHSADGKRHFYAAGLGDCADDAFWKVDVDGAGNVKPSVFWLNAQHPVTTEVYDVDYWRKKMAEMQPQLSESFWKRQWKGLLVGTMVGMGLLVLFQWVIRRLRRR